MSRKNGFLPKEKLNEFLERLAAKARLFVPVEDGGAIIFKPYSASEKLRLDVPANTPPKSVIFPQSEVLFSFNQHKDPEDAKKLQIDLDAKTDIGPAVIFGARPCDAKGFVVYDRVYLGEDYPDPYYRERREKTSIVTLACQSPSAGCFCTSVGGSPSDTEGSDVIMTELDNGMYLEAVTDKGDALLADPAAGSGESSQAEAKKRQDAVAAQVGKPLGEKGLPDIAIDIFSKDEFWTEETERCLSCGACTYVCPTCYCFNITDEAVAGKGERIRSWDACMFQHFTLEGSGHTPRPLKYQRYRNRVGHKFFYYPEKYSGSIACCGCGRCIRSCPVSIDISEVVAHISERQEEFQKKQNL